MIEVDWYKVGESITAVEQDWELNDGQRASLRAIAVRLPTNGVILADEVGMGKTRIAAVLAKQTVAAGGRVAILVPPGLGFQWQEELDRGGLAAPGILRSLSTYFDAWAGDASSNKPWFNEPVVILSHVFCNWRLSAKSDGWRWALFPELYGRWRKHTQGRFPRGFHDHPSLYDARVDAAADDIAALLHDGACSPASSIRYRQLMEEASWVETLDPANYGRGEAMRKNLAESVGLGLGAFDLIIVDEAHKSRGELTGLSRLLDTVLVSNPNARRVGMTATPVELDSSQWASSLRRIGFAGGNGEFSRIVSDYVHAAEKIRRDPASEPAFEQFRGAAHEFQNSLAPYVLRRDKREDRAVKSFSRHSRMDIHAYRQQQALEIELGSMELPWQKAVCAAEALSFAASRTSNHRAQRLRLTIANGHGLAAVLNDEKSMAGDSGDTSAPTGDHSAPANHVETKREKRVQWWVDCLEDAFKQQKYPLYHHPAILATIQKIEDVCQVDGEPGEGEKVLVFGKFTAPLVALTRLLNAREMLRCIYSGRPWSQSKIPEDQPGDQPGAWDVIKIAHLQLKGTGGVPSSIDRYEVNDRLEAQYRQLENTRKRYQNRLRRWLSDRPDNSVGKAIAEAFAAPLERDINDNHPLAILARAMMELSNSNEPDLLADDQLASTFASLLKAAASHDDLDSDEGKPLDDKAVQAESSKLIDRLTEEYSRPEGGFARLMYGDTNQETRRFLQLAFNRRHSYPRVLIAQSTVGREGLNLHLACRTVILLHPEWNPGVVEQQVGRVDRVGSYWEQLLDTAVQSGNPAGSLPRINIHPVIFRGTYDQKNWAVLQERWDSLRAQLHGIVIPLGAASASGVERKRIDQINDEAPNFSPSRDTGSTNQNATPGPVSS